MHSLLPHYKATLRLGLPIAIGQIGVIVMGFADTMMVGRYSTDSLAAASFVNNVFTLVTFLIMGYSYGLTPIIGAITGRGDKQAAGATLKQALVANSCFGAVLLGIMTCLYFFVDHMGQPDEILPLVRPYYIVILVSMVFVLIFNAIRQFTDGTTDTATGMWILLAGNVINIVLNYFLIYGVGPFPEWGLLGAGIATLVARVCMAVALILTVAFRRRYAPFREGWHASKVSLSEVLHINRKSLPVSLQMGMESGAFTFSAIMAGWIGAIPLASYQVMVTIGTLGFLFYYSFGAGMSIRVAAFVGQNDWPRVRLAAKAGCHLLFIMATLACLTFYFFGETLIRFFSSDPAVIATAMTLIFPLMLYQYGDAMQICFANALRGTSQVMSMMWIAFVSYFVVNIPMGYVLGFICGFGIRGIFLAFSLGLFTAAPLFYYQFRRVQRAHMAVQ
ncbi:MAG: MATE family efflux transporter [Bacteroidales bacterium]|nr:MATE family efflux transporter [Bacteroidales bacterium]